MRIAVLSNADPYSKMTFSGTSYSIVRQLEKYFDVFWINPTTKLSNRISYLFNYRQLRQGKFFLNQAPIWVSRLESAKLNRLVKEEPVDAIFNIGMAVPLYYFDKSVKLINFSDISMRQMIEHYYTIETGHSSAIHRAEKRESQALLKSDFVVTTSDWCANSIMKDYHVAPDLVQTIKVGANMDITLESKSAPSGDTIHLLFCGIDAVRKGLDIAADAVAWLNQQDDSKRYVLDVVGLTQADGITGDHVIYHGLLNKNKPEEEAKLKDFYRQSDLLILPTRMDTIGIVFLEAMSFGLPILTCDTGGVSEYVHHDQNGYCLPLEATGEDFGKKALELIQDPHRYEQFSRRGVELVREELNWDHWGQTIAPLIKQLIEKK